MCFPLLFGPFLQLFRQPFGNLLALSTVWTLVLEGGGFSQLCTQNARLMPPTSRPAEGHLRSAGAHEPPADFLKYNTRSLTL